LAYRFLREVAAGGNCMVSGGLESLAPDAASRYAFALVNVEVTRQFNDRFNPEATASNVAFMQRRAELRRAPLSSAQVAQGRALARNVIAACR
jgi:hypothetical protein